MASKFNKYFKESLTLKEADMSLDPTGEGHQAVFNQSVDYPAAAEQVEAELQNASISPEQRAGILKKADKYAENISTVILPMLRKLHDSIVTGEFKDIAPDIKGISNITEDLASLAESLRARTRDAIIKADKNESKTK